MVQFKTPEEIQEFRKKILNVEEMPNLIVDLTPSKNQHVLKEILNEGTENGHPPLGNEVSIYYTLYTSDGDVVESQQDDGKHFKFTLGKNEVIKGMDLAVASMKLEERALIWIKEDYAYGTAGRPPAILPNADLILDIKLMNWSSLYRSFTKLDTPILKERTLIYGEGLSTPSDGAEVEVHIVGRTFSNRVFDDRLLYFTIGEYVDAKVCQGVDHAIRSLKKGERSVFYICPELAFELTGNAEHNFPSGVVVQYEIELKSFINPKERYDLGPAETIKQCELLKNKATKYFKMSEYSSAFRLYNRIKELTKTTFDSNDEERTQIKALHLSTLLNMNLCHFKRHDYHSVRRTSTEILKIDSANEKALFRRGVAHLKLKEVELAIQDLNECLRINPDNRAAQTHLQECRSVHKSEIKRERHVYANMFDKFAQRDTQREESQKEKEPNVMSCVGEWGIEDREREPSEFEKENPNILLLTSSEEFKDM